jgi:hypothetical protein
MIAQVRKNTRDLNHPQNAALDARPPTAAGKAADPLLQVTAPP